MNKQKNKLLQAMLESKPSRFRSWKSGKRWIYSASILTVLVGGIVTASLTHPQWIESIAHAANVPSDFTQVGSIGSAPLYKTPNTSWTNIQKAVDALTEGQTPDYYVGAVDADGNGQKVGWHDGQTVYNGTTLGSLASANPADLSTPNYNFVKNAIMTSDGFQDGDNFNYVTGAGQYVGIHNVGEAFEVSSGKYVPIGIKVTINDATYYDSSSATTPRDVFGDGYKLMVAARNDGNGNITLGYVVVMNGVPAVDNGGGSEGGGSGGGSGATSGGCTTGIPRMIDAVITYVNEDTGQALPNNSLSVVKVGDIDAGQAAKLSSNSLGYFISDPTNLSLQNNVLTASTDHTVNQNQSSLDANSYISLTTGSSMGLVFTDTLGNNQQGSIIQSLFGTNGVTLNPSGYVQLDKTTVQYGDDLPNSWYGFTPLQFQIIDKDGKVVDTLSVDQFGKSPKSKALTPGDYTLHEISSNWAATGQTQRPDVKFHVKGGETTEITGDDLANQAVQGQIKIVKKGVESGTDLWNGNYSLTGNQFKITKLDGADAGKTYTVTTDTNGLAQTSTDLALGKYKVEEIQASDGFVNTFKPVEVELTYKDNQTQLVFDTATGTNQEIKGQNQINKEDKETGTDPHGKGDMTTAKYGWFYNDTSTGSSPHKPGDPVKWSDIPNAKLLDGEKVTSAVINGSTVNFGDNVVVQLNSKDFAAAVGNLAAGKYYVQELDAGEGYTVDSTKHEFEITKKDDNTANIVTPNTLSKEQLIKARISLQKLAETAGSASNGSGYNGVEFTFTPMAGTNSTPVKVTTGINPATDEDGYAATVLDYGDWKVSETKGINGYDKIPDFYIHMFHDTKTDLLTITASNNEDGSNPFSSRTFNVTDNATTSNPNDGDTIIAGNTDEDSPFVSLSKFILTNKPSMPQDTNPSIDIEKADGTKIPDAGKGNYSDKDNNVGSADRDTEATALITGDKVTDISGRITNNGDEDLTHLVFTDKTIAGHVNVGDIKVTYQGKQLTTNNKGEFMLDGKLFTLKVGEYLEIHGQLPVLPEGETHGDEMEITGVGVTSNKSVGDEDKWYGKRPKPSIDIEKANNTMPNAGQGNNTDKDNNAGPNDHDTKATAALTDDKKTLINFKVTNNGKEDLTHVKVADKTTDGKTQVTDIVWTYKGQKLTTNKDGELELNGKLLVLKVGETIEATGYLPVLPDGELHGDDATVSAEGVLSGQKVGDHDRWYGKRPKPSIDIEKANGTYPKAGQGNNTDKPNNGGVNDHDTKDTALSVNPNQATTVYFTITNNGDEALKQVKVVDKTIDGQVDVTKLTWTYKGQKLTFNAAGELMLNGKLLVLGVGEQIKGQGELPGLAANATHGDEATVSGVGVISGKQVGDKDQWFAKAVSTVPLLTFAQPSNSLPHTGSKNQSYLVYGGMLAIAAAIGASVYYMKKRKSEETGEK